MQILVDDLTGADVAELLGEHLRDMRTITPVEHAYALDLDELRRPEITFWTAYDDGVLLGCAALKQLSPTHGEVKSMRTSANRTRGGVASLLLDHLVGEARRRGYTKLSLETGTDEFFLPARRLYEKFGFTYCDAFGEYEPSPHNTFMTRDL
ncbi:GNAT family N-acetyltransferase [Actinophytocola oryzae]|uniref:Putative acetyltransferase n=1 Tax=Actinophytocola oryzae TaxID=502181 RepID=A0A4R7V6A5_9PSEU|nr:GNAT family N-acetyltransferase [Actinophytocola oryzae]TDV43545.1 putative acetyltransferase [Actinophytocola oryzae]